jgi:hypothetical protein
LNCSRALVAALVATTAVLQPTVALAKQSDGSPIRARARGDAVETLAARRLRGQNRSAGSASSASAGPVSVVVYVPACLGNAPSAQVDRDALCVPAMSFCASVDAPDSVLYWRYRAVQDAAGALGAWTYVGQVCRRPSEVATTPLPELTLRDFQRLPLPAGGVHVQPGSGRVLVNVDMNVFVSAGPVTLSTTLVGFGVQVRARPVRFEWAFGDGRVLTTTDPGGAYPAMSTTHVYAGVGRRQVSLRTFYAGEYSVAGGAWQPVEGEAVVASAPVAVEVIEARGHLVDDLQAG